MEVKTQLSLMTDVSSWKYVLFCFHGEIYFFHTIFIYVLFILSDSMILVFLILWYKHFVCLCWKVFVLYFNISSSFQWNHKINCLQIHHHITDRLYIYCQTDAILMFIVRHCRVKRNLNSWALALKVRNTHLSHNSSCADKTQPP